MTLVDNETQMRDKNSSSFCYRAIAGSTKLSKHARGLAIDINTFYNPYYKDRADGTWTSCKDYQHFELIE